MFVANEDLSVFCTRGDYCEFPVKHDFKAGDVIRFKATRKKDCNTVVIQRDFVVEADTDSFMITLSGDDTKIGEVISKPVDYWYEIELNPDTQPETIIAYDEKGAKIFRLYPEGKDVDGEDIEVVGHKTLQELVDYALLEAKETGMFDGEKGDPGYTPQRGVDYWTEEDDAKLNEANKTAKEAKAIANGRATGYVFDTVNDMTMWLRGSFVDENGNLWIDPDLSELSKEHRAMLNLGDNLYIRDTGVPDYWWDGEKEQELETQKVDMTEYVKNTDYAANGGIGVVKFLNVDTGKYGIKRAKQSTHPGAVTIEKATEAEIDAREQAFKPIVPKNLEYAVHSVLKQQPQAYFCNGKPSFWDDDLGEPARGDYIGQLRHYNCKEYDEYGEAVYVLRVYMYVGTWDYTNGEAVWALLYESYPFVP